MNVYFTALNDKEVMVLDKIELKNIINSNFCFDNCIYDEKSGLVFSKICNVMEREKLFKDIIMNEMDIEDEDHTSFEPIEIENNGNLIDLIEWSHKIICQKIFKKQYESGIIKV